MITTANRLESWRRSNRQSMNQIRRNCIAKAPVMAVRTIKN
jgi:hypothetical protein